MKALCNLDRHAPSLERNIPLTISIAAIAARSIANRQNRDSHVHANMGGLFVASPLCTVDDPLGAPGDTAGTTLTSQLPPAPSYARAAAGTTSTSQLPPTPSCARAAAGSRPLALSTSSAASGSPCANWHRVVLWWQ